jgi:hypothetical protein
MTQKAARFHSPGEKSGLEHPVGELQIVLQEAARKSKRLSTTDLDLSGDAFRRNREDIREPYLEWVKRRSDELVPEVLAALAGRGTAFDERVTDHPGDWEVTIDTTDNNNYILKSNWGLDCPITPRDTLFLELLARKVASGTAAEPIPWRPLNAATDKTKASRRSASGGHDDLNDEEGENQSGEPRSKDAASNQASSALRTRLTRLNSRVVKSLGPTPNGMDWFKSVKRQGLQLNTSVRWSVSDEWIELHMINGKLYVHNVDSKVLEETQPDRGEKLQARNRRPKGRMESSEDDK